MPIAFLEKTPGLLLPTLDKNHPNMGWIRLATGVAAFGYILLCLISSYFGTGGLSMLLQEGMASLILSIAFVLSPRRPLFAIYVTLGTVFWELCLSYFHTQSIEVSSVGVFPVLILAGGMLVGVRGVTVLATSAALMVPLMVYLSGGWGYDFRLFKPDIDGDAFAVFELTILVTAILTRAVLVSYHRAHSTTELARQRYKDLFDNAPDGLVALDEASRILEANPVACRILGTDLSSLRGAVLHQVWKNVGGQGAFDMKAALGGSLLSLEMRNSEGLSRHLEVSARTEPSLSSHALLIFRDVTQHRLVQERLGHAQRLECVGQLAGGVAHDFNNLLTVVGGNASLLVSHPDAEVRTQATDIMDASSRGAGLIRQLLAFARRDVHRPALIDLGSSLSGMTRLVHPLLGERCRLQLSCPERVHVLFDLTQLEQVVMNLVSNAKDAMPSGGVVRITARSLPLSEARHLGSTLETQEQVLLEVADEGVGMSAAVKARVFEPFFSTKPRGHGTGLGLASAHGIVAQNRGVITLDSAAGAGTRVRIFLPQQGEMTAKVDFASGVEIPKGGGQHLLLVEDEDSVRSLVSRMLTRGGYRVTEAGDAETALAFFQQDPGVDMLLTDVVMPGVSGPSLALQVRSLRPDLPVLFMSGHLEGEVEKHSSGNVDILGRLISKPFSSEQLLERVHSVLSQRP